MLTFPSRFKLLSSQAITNFVSRQIHCIQSYSNKYFFKINLRGVYLGGWMGGLVVHYLAYMLFWCWTHELHYGQHKDEYSSQGEGTMGIYCSTHCWGSYALMIPCENCMHPYTPRRRSNLTWLSDLVTSVTTQFSNRTVVQKVM